MTLEADDDADYYEEASPEVGLSSPEDQTQVEHAGVASSGRRSEELEFGQGSEQEIPDVNESGHGQILQSFEMDATDMLAAAARRLRGFADEGP